MISKKNIESNTKKNTYQYSKEKDTRNREFRSLIRTRHNRENPFVQINKNALLDPNLSHKAVGVWVRCMARPDNWKFCVKEMTKTYKGGKTALYSAIKELIENNYCCKFVHKPKKNGFIFGEIIEYVFFEFPATEEEKAAEHENFKNFYRHSGFDDTDRHSGFMNTGDRRSGFQPLLIQTPTVSDVTGNVPVLKEEVDTEDRAHTERVRAGGEQRQKKPCVCTDFSSSSNLEAKKQNSLKEEREKFSCRDTNDSAISAETEALSERMLVLLRKYNEAYRTPRNMLLFLKTVESMLVTYEADYLLKVLEWALKDTTQRGEFFGWSSVIYSKDCAAQQLKRFIEKIAAQMKSQKPRKFDPSSKDDEAKARYAEMRRRAIR